MNSHSSVPLLCTQLSKKLKVCKWIQIGVLVWRFVCLAWEKKKMKGGGEIIMGKTVTFSSSSRRSLRQRKTHKWLLAYHVLGHFVKMDLCGFLGRDSNLFLVWSTRQRGELRRGMLEALCNGPALFRSGTLALLKSQQGDVSRQFQGKQKDYYFL